MRYHHFAIIDSYQKHTLLLIDFINTVILFYWLLLLTQCGFTTLLSLILINNTLCYWLILFHSVLSPRYYHWFLSKTYFLLIAFVNTVFDCFWWRKLNTIWTITTLAIIDSYQWNLTFLFALIIDCLCQQKQNIVSKLNRLECKYWDLTGFGALKTTNSNKRFHAKILLLPISFWFSLQLSKKDYFSKTENNSTLVCGKRGESWPDADPSNLGG